MMSAVVATRWVRQRGAAVVLDGDGGVATEVASAAVRWWQRDGDDDVMVEMMMRRLVVAAKVVKVVERRLTGDRPEVLRKMRGGEEEDMCVEAR
ncbi:hypothetical protein Tco_0615734, partial [Tanacetum coccineum]